MLDLFNAVLIVGFAFRRASPAGLVRRLGRHRYGLAAALGREAQPAQQAPRSGRR